MAVRILNFGDAFGICSTVNFVLSRKFVCILLLFHKSWACFCFTGYEMVFEGSEREHTCYELIPGYTYRVRVAACSVGGRSDVSSQL